MTISAGGRPRTDPSRGRRVRAARQDRARRDGHDLQGPPGLDGPQPRHTLIIDMNKDGGKVLIDDVSVVRAEPAAPAGSPEKKPQR
jgi:hypothetical protein